MKKRILSLIMIFAFTAFVIPKEINAYTPSPTETYTSGDLILGGQVKIDGQSVSVGSHGSNGYTAVSNNYNNYQVTIPNTYKAAINNFDIAIIESARLKVHMQFTGSLGVESNVGWFLDASLSGLGNVTRTGSSNQVLDLDFDARGNYTTINFQAWMFDARGSFSVAYNTQNVRILSVTLEIKYHYDNTDEISPILDGAGSLVKSKNILLPDLTGKEKISESVYRINAQHGITIDYDTSSGNYIFNGTSSGGVSIPNPTILKAPGTYTAQMIIISGTTTSSGGWIFGDNESSNQHYVYFSGKTGGLIKTIETVSESTNLKFYSNAGSTYDNFTIKLQLEIGSTATEWTHPNYKYYSTASIQNDLNPDSVPTIMSNVYAYDDLDGNITDRFQVVDTPRKYAAVLANKYGLRVNEVLNAYDNDTLNVPITNTITLNKAHVDNEFLSYRETTYWYNYQNQTLITHHLSDSYKFIAYVGDNAGNYSFLEISVFLTDATAPVFSTENELTITISYKVTFDLNSWKETLIITDNVSDVITRTIYTDNYTSKKTIPGTYTVVIRATDDVGNYADKTFTINVIDDIAPVINGPEQIMKPQSSTMTINDIRSRFTAYDEISGNVTSRINVKSDGYTGRGHLAGTYTVIFEVSDMAGNKSEYTLLIIVSDDIPPVIYVADGYFIQVSSAYTLTLNGIRDILIATGRLNMISATTYEVLVNEYAGNEEKPGIYTISIRFSQTSGISEVHSVAVNVKNATSNPEVINPPRNNSNIWIYLGIGGAVILFVLYKKKK